MRSDLEIFVLFFGVVLVMFCLLLFIVAIYIAYFRANEILDNLSNSTFVGFNRYYLAAGPFGRLLFIGKVSAVLTFPRRHLESGVLNAQDYSLFPRRLMFLFKVINYSVWILAALFLITWAAGNGLGLYG
jgi:hypothetical protein